MKNPKKTIVFYSYFDDQTGKRLTSSDGVIIEGEVTPARVKAAVLKKWAKIGYHADAESIEIEAEETVLS